MGVALIPSYEDPGGTYPNAPGPSTYIPGSNVGENARLNQASLSPALKYSGIPEWRQNLSQLLMIAGAGIDDLSNKTDNSTKMIMAFHQAQEARGLMKLQMQAMKGLAQIDVAATQDPDAALKAYDRFISGAPEQLDPKILQYAMNARQTLATGLAFVKVTAGLTGSAKADFIRGAWASAGGKEFPALAQHINSIAQAIEETKPTQAHIVEGQLVLWDPKDPEGTRRSVKIPGLTAKPPNQSVEEMKMDAVAGFLFGESWGSLIKTALDPSDPARAEQARQKLGRISSEAVKDPKLNTERDVLAVTMYGPDGRVKKYPSVKDLGSLAQANSAAAEHVLERAAEINEAAKGGAALQVARAQLQAADEQEPDPAKYRFFNIEKLKKGQATEMTFETIGDAKKSNRAGISKRVSTDQAKAVVAAEGMNSILDTMASVAQGLSPQSGWGVLVQSLGQPFWQALGVAGTPTELGVMQAYKLRFARILQSAGGTGGGQVSDPDARAAAMAIIGPNDSIGSAAIKLAIGKRLNHINMLLEAGLSPTDLGVSAYTREEANDLERRLRGVTKTHGTPAPKGWTSRRD